jgi:hypothetical protein
MTGVQDTPKPLVRRVLPRVSYHVQLAEFPKGAPMVAARVYTHGRYRELKAKLESAQHAVTVDNAANRMTDQLNKIIETVCPPAG